MGRLPRLKTRSDGARRPGCCRAMPQCAVTSSPGLLSKCVSSGAVSQEELASAYSSQSSFFSSQLHEAEQRIQMQKELEKLQLELELLKQDKKNADVTHASYLAARLQALQTFCTHLQDVLKDHKLLAQRLSRPLGGTSLPIPAHLHRFVVQVVHMAMDFVETLDEKRSAVSRRADAAADLDQLKTSVSQLLAVASEEEVLANRLLGCKDVCDSRLSDSSSS
ncbi:HAUS augmin-like complex subunit 2 isoform X2 [Hippocampus zosterae]|uniref:HAUS augmin-like complex subunit 2 isoform X2 n=1 Tax=Hippocampus zosterae TaxID=109293 RepID=UPI00223DF89D|nr:HAUS augmin-like complex subunit 2 isoform X2 [Hippocampus zosterae]